MHPLASYIREQRHIFGVCPHCHALFRLADIKVSYGNKYKLDWLDRLDNKREKWETMIADLEEDENELRKKAIEKVRKKELPKLLKSIIPTFAMYRLDPQDIKTVFHPIDFVAFNGLNAGRMDKVLMLDHKSSDSDRISIQRSISDTIKSDAIEWQTVRVGPSGEISVE